MDRITLQERRTHRYVGTHRHLDRWRDVGTATVTPFRPSRPARHGDAGDGGAYVAHARIPRAQDARASMAALADYYTAWGCAHEYDCCGCRSTWARVRRIGRRDFIVVLRVSFNY